MQASVVTPGVERKPKAGFAKAHSGPNPAREILGPAAGLRGRGVLPVLGLLPLGLEPWRKAAA